MVAVSGSPADDEVVRFEHVSKNFRRFDARPFLLRQALLSLVGRRRDASEIEALHDVSFALRSGESVAIVGLNRAGKSTLLRLIAGTLFPTQGRVSVRGRVIALLSLGLGFHPDMTGKECILVNAALLGMTRAEVEQRFDAIVRFAELESFLHMPIRHYSSGMQARLGVAVAIHASPQVMLIDEALTVGDHAFQAKCMRRLQELRSEGATLVLVSHAPNVVRETCSRAIWLDEGRVVIDGEAAVVVERYLSARK